MNMLLEIWYLSLGLWKDLAQRPSARLGAFQDVAHRRKGHRYGYLPATKGQVY